MTNVTIKRIKKTFVILCTTPPSHLEEISRSYKLIIKVLGLWYQINYYKHEIFRIMKESTVSYIVYIFFITFELMNPIHRVRGNNKRLPRKFIFCSRVQDIQLCPATWHDKSSFEELKLDYHWTLLLCLKHTNCCQHFIKEYQFHCFISDSWTLFPSNCQIYF